MKVTPRTTRSRALRLRLRDSDGALVASGFVVALMAVISLGAIWSQGDHPVWVQIIGSILALAVAVTFGVFQWRLVRGHVDPRLTRAGVIVIVLAIANVYVSDTWATLGVAAAMAVLILPRLGWLAAFATLLAGAGAVVTGQTSPTGDIAIPVISVVVAVGLHTLTRLAQALTEVRISREQLARLHVDGERDRISRDLHDIIGRTLVAASLRLQSASHLLDRDIERTREQLEQAQKALADGQSELRRVTRGPITTSLADELQAAQGLCDRLRVHLTVDTPQEATEDPQPLAARVVREGITNMLKHSQPRNCEIRIVNNPALDITIINDGRPPMAWDDQSFGTGLTDLQHRLQLVGLSLTAGPRGADDFLLHVGGPESTGG